MERCENQITAPTSDQLVPAIIRVATARRLTIPGHCSRATSAISQTFWRITMCQMHSSHTSKQNSSEWTRLHRAPRLFLRVRSEEHTSELQSLMRISYAVFCLKKKKEQHNMPTL